MSQIKQKNQLSTFVPLSLEKAKAPTEALDKTSSIETVKGFQNTFEVGSTRQEDKKRIAMGLSNHSQQTSSTIQTPQNTVRLRDMKGGFIPSIKNPIPENTPNSARINSAQQEIRTASYQGPHNLDVLPSGLKTIQKAMKELNSEDFNAVIDQLEPNKLSNMCSELYSGASGLDRTERIDFLRDVMRKANPSNARKMTRALQNSVYPENERKGLMDELGEAVSQLSTTQQSNFLEGTRPLLKEERSQVGRAAMKVLGSMGSRRGAVMSQQLSTYNDSELSALVEQSVKGERKGMTGYSMDMDSLQGVLGKMSSASSETKARMFRAVSQECHSLSAIGRMSLKNQHSLNDAAKGLAYSKAIKGTLSELGGMIQSDCHGVMQALQRQDPEAEQLGKFFATTIDSSENGGKIAPEAKQMLQGLAKNLGDSSQNGMYFAGGLKKGIGELHSRLDWDANVMATAMSALEGLAGTFLPFSAKSAQALSGFVSGGLGNIFNTAFVGYMMEPTKESYEELEKILLKQ